MKASFHIAGLVVICFAAVCSFEAYAQQPATQNSPEIWLSPQGIPNGALAANDDFMEMFNPDAPWKEAAAHTQVFALYATKLHTSQDQVNALVADLNRRHIKIALEVGVITTSRDDRCGGMEGYGKPEVASQISKMIENAGGRIAYIVMDEPMAFGHFKTGVHITKAGKEKVYCNSPVNEIVNQIAPILNIYIQEFPDIEIGDVEPTEIAGYPNWQTDLQAFATTFRQTMKRPLAFMHLDIPWTAGRPGEEPAHAVAFYQYMQELQRQGLIGKIGIIWNGSGKDESDAAWVQNAKNHVLLLEGKYGLHPDHAIFQSWVAHPAHSLPESAPDTLTSLIDWYFSAARQ